MNAVTTTRPRTRDGVRTIDDPRHPVARRIGDVLRSHSSRPRTFVIDDPENIEQARRSGVEIESLYTTGSGSADALAQLTEDIGRDVPRYALDEKVAQDLFGGRKQARIFALARAPLPARLRDLAGRPGDLIVLDGVRIPGNIGAIIRTARALDTAGVVLLDSGLRTVLDRRLIRASRGLVLATATVIATHAQWRAFAEREGLSIAALTADAAEPLHRIADVPQHLALVLGGERRGVSPEMEALATHRYAIPMSAGVESLNVSVTAGIALYEHRAASGTVGPRSDH